MHRLLTAAGCRVAAVGNAAWLRYGPQVLPDHARAAGYPLLVANLRTPGGAQLPGTRPSAVVEAGGVRVGFVGVSATLQALFPGFDMGRPGSTGSTSGASIWGTGARASVLGVPGDLPPHPAVTAAAAAVEPEVAGILAEPIGVLDRPLDPQWVAEMLRERMGAEVGLVVANQALQGTLPAGPVLRGELWELCESSANPGVTAMTGAQLAELIERGRDRAFMDERPRPLRGRPRRYLHVSGPAELDPDRTYAVAGTDYELEPYGGLVSAEWALQVRYDFPVIVREAIEERLRLSP